MSRYTLWWLSICSLTTNVSLFACKSESKEISAPKVYPAEQDDAYTPQPYADGTPTPVSARRLTKNQFQNSIHDVFGSSIVIPDVAEPDVEIAGLLSVGASSSSYSPRGVESLETVSYAVAEQVISNQDVYSQIITCTPQSIDDIDCIATVLEEVGARLWRRPLTTEEMDDLTSVTQNACQVLNSFDEGIVFGLAGLIQSPHFLYRIELGEQDPENPERRRFTGHELASRLSYFLWNSTPDEELILAAEAGDLHTDSGLRIQTQRLLDSPRARTGVANFFHEQLELYDLEGLSKDPTIFEHYNTELGSDAREETLRLIEYIIFEAELDFRELLTIRESFVNPRLAAIYNIPAPNAEGDFGYVEFPTSYQRVGLLGQISFLALHSHSVSTSATLRGKAVRSILLCQEMPAPPVEVDTSIPEPSGTTLTLRDRVAEHLENPSCAGCHQLMDPIGLGLENFDGIGRWRDRDNGELIDSTGELDGTPFNDPSQLGKAVAAHPNFSACLVRTLGRYVNGHVESSDEAQWLTNLNDRFVAHEYRVKELLVDIVMSPVFRQAGPIEE